MKFMARGGFSVNTKTLTIPATANGSPFKEHSRDGLRIIRECCKNAWQDPSFGKAERDAYHAATRGELPQDTRSDILSLSCDPGYFRQFGTSFIASHHAVQDPSVIHLHLTLPDDESVRMLERIQERLGPERFTYTISTSDIHHHLNYNGVYLTCARFIHTHRLMAQCGTRCVNVDIDSIVRAPIGAFLDTKLKNKDIAYIRRWTRLKVSRMVLASALVYTQSPLGLRFSDALSRALVKILHKGPQYHIDQTVLYYLTVAAARDGLRAATMGLELADHHFAPDSPIWSAKGRKRKKNPAFLKAATAAASDFEGLMQ